MWARETGEVCARCVLRPPIEQTKHCGYCRAENRVRQLPGMRHNVVHLAGMYVAAHDPLSTCVILKRPLHTLRKVGETLSVDRIDPTLGYTKANTRLLASSLNEAKGDDPTIPQRAINKLLRKLATVCEDRQSDERGATRRV